MQLSYLVFRVHYLVHKLTDIGIDDVLAFDHIGSYIPQLLLHLSLLFQKSIFRLLEQRLFPC